MFMGPVATRGNEKAKSLGCHTCSRAMLLQGVILIWVACAATQNLADIQARLQLRAMCWSEALPYPVSVVMSIAPISPKVVQTPRI